MDNEDEKTFSPIVPIIMAVFIALFVIFVGGFVVDSITKQIERTDDSMTPAPWIVIVILAIPIICLILVGRAPLSDEDEELDSTIDTDKIALHSVTKNGINAEKILKKRYAEGKISHEDYTERMSRL